MVRQQRTARDAELRGKLEELTASLGRSAPNLKAVEQYEAVREREKEQVR